MDKENKFSWVSFGIGIGLGYIFVAILMWVASKSLILAGIILAVLMIIGLVIFIRWSKDD